MSRADDSLVQLREHHWPSLPMPIAGGLAGEAGVLKAKTGGAADRLQLDRDDGFSAVGTARAG
jgi:hypothetical protein